MCLILQDEGEIPIRSALLYERAIRLLLRKWNDDKAISGWEIGTEFYRNLNIEQKENLLIKIAAQKFEYPKNFILFDQDDLIKKISQHLNLLNRNSALAILKAIESQHGLLVERADELWSFSHLTFQEYFTTKWLISLPSEELIRKISDPQWQGIVQQLIKAQGQSDRLLRLIKQAIDYSIEHDKKLQEVLCWGLEKAQLIIPPYQPSLIQALYGAHSLLAHSLGLSFKLNLSLELDLSLDNNLILARNLTYNLVLTRDFLTRALHLANDPEFVNHLQQLKDRLPNTSEIHDFAIWLKSDGQVWKTELRQSMITHRNIGHDWQLISEQMCRLQVYYDTNKFLVELLNIKNAVSPEVRQEIEDNLLLPIAELKRRLPDQYGS